MQDTREPEQEGSIRSMTGFGRARAARDDLEVIVEIRSVNHRYLDIYTRMSKAYAIFEPHLKKIVADRVGRGKIDLNVTRTGTVSTVADVAIDQRLAQRYYESLVELKTRHGIEADITISDILTLREIVVTTENEEQIEKELPLVEQCLHDALDSLNTMRTAEGAATWRDMVERLSTVRSVAALVAPLKEQVVANARERLQKRIAELTGGMDLNEDRLLQEVAIISDRADITEELTRLESHINQFLQFGETGSPIGRKMDFLLQEINRELNTIGSKSGSAEIGSHVVTMKAEVEKIREQAQNME